MRVISPHDLANDLGTFAGRRLGIQAHLIHGIEDAPVNRLEPVAHIRQGAVRYGRESLG